MFPPELTVFGATLTPRDGVPRWQIGQYLVTATDGQYTAQVLLDAQSLDATVWPEVADVISAAWRRRTAEVA